MKTSKPIVLRSGYHGTSIMQYYLLFIYVNQRNAWLWEQRWHQFVVSMVRNECWQESWLIHHARSCNVPFWLYRPCSQNGGTEISNCSSQFFIVSWWRLETALIIWYQLIIIMQMSILANDERTGLINIIIFWGFTHVVVKGIRLNYFFWWMTMCSIPRSADRVSDHQPLAVPKVTVLLRVIFGCQLYFIVIVGNKSRQRYTGETL